MKTGSDSATTKKTWSFELVLVLLLPALAVCGSTITAYVAYAKGFNEIPLVTASAHHHSSANH